MTRTIRNFGLTAHISFSVGWFGAVAGFFALSIAGLLSQSSQIIRGSYVAMHLLSWYVILPFCLLSLLTGLIQSLSTQWGLFRHYWIIAKLVLTVIATIVLLLHMQPITYLGGMAFESTFTETDYRGLRIQLLADSGAALLVLLTTIAFSVYKPWGRTVYGLRKQFGQNSRMTGETSSIKRLWPKYLLLTAGIFVIVTFILLHLTGVLKRH